MNKKYLWLLNIHSVGFPSLYFKNVFIFQELILIDNIPLLLNALHLSLQFILLFIYRSIALHAGIFMNGLMRDGYMVCMYVTMYVCMHGMYICTCMYICIYVCMVCIYVHVCTCMYVHCMYVCMHACMYVFKCMYIHVVCMYVCNYVCMYVHVCIYM